jgi:hypothetical protein
MKIRNLILGAGILVLSSSFENSNAAVSHPPACKQSLSPTDTIITPPATVTTSFMTRYPKASNVKWYQYKSSTVPIEWDLTGWPVLTERDYTVMYDLDNAKYYAWYDAQGNWVGSTYQMTDFAGLPAPVSKMLSAKYAGYTITNVHNETYKDLSAYQIEMTKGSEKVKMIVDPNGTVLKQKTKKVDASGNEIKEKVKMENK